MKFRYAVVAFFTVFATMFGVASAQHHHDTATPAGEHDGHNMDMDMGNMSTGAFYFTIKNNGEESDRLVKVETDMAEVVEIHDVKMDGGVMKMQPQHDGVEIPAGEEVVLKPGSYHVMMIGLTESLIDGEEFTATLYFEHAGEVEVVVPIYKTEPEDSKFADPIKVGDDIEVSKIWARQAPKLDGMATPMATPDATPGH